MTPIIRAARLDDATLLARLHGECFAQSWDAVSFRRLIETQGAFALLAKTEVATESQSFIVVQTAADQSEILTIGTVPSAQKRGLASAILKAAAAEAVRYNAREMFLEVAEDNEAALALYENAGFVVTGRRRDYYLHAHGSAHAWTLRASLPL